MANNLIIAYDLNKPDQDYEAIEQAILGLGDGLKIQQSVWYVKSDSSPQEAFQLLSKALGENDFLFVTRAAEAAWRLPKAVSLIMKDRW